MKDNNFIVIQGWMVNRLHLKNMELVIYALLYSYGQGQCGYMTTKEELRQHLAELCATTTFYRAFNNLTAKHLVSAKDGNLIAVVPPEEPDFQNGNGDFQNGKNPFQNGNMDSQNGNAPINIKKNIPNKEMGENESEKLSIDEQAAKYLTYLQ